MLDDLPVMITDLIDKKLVIVLDRSIVLNFFFLKSERQVILEKLKIAYRIFFFFYFLDVLCFFYWSPTFSKNK